MPQVRINRHWYICLWRREHAVTHALSLATHVRAQALCTRAASTAASTCRGRWATRSSSRMRSGQPASSRSARSLTSGRPSSTPPQTSWCVATPVCACRACARVRVRVCVRMCFGIGVLGGDVWWHMPVPRGAERASMPWGPMASGAYDALAGCSACACSPLLLLYPLTPPCPACAAAHAQLLCSDGVWNSMKEKVVLRFVKQRLARGHAPADVCRDLCKGEQAARSLGSGSSPLCGEGHQPGAGSMRRGCMVHSGLEQRTVCAPGSGRACARFATHAHSKREREANTRVPTHAKMKRMHGANARVPTHAWNERVR